MSLSGASDLSDVIRLRRLLGKRLREEQRKRRDTVPASLRRHCSQTGIAERVGVDYTTVSRWETGQREPDLSRLAQLAATLDVTLAVLLSDVGGAIAARPRPTRRKGVVV